MRQRVCHVILKMTMICLQFATIHFGRPKAGTQSEMNSSVISKAIELRDPTLPGKALTEIDLLLRSTADLNEKVYLLFSKSSCLGILGNFDEARQQLTLALQQGPDDPEIRLTVEFNEGLLCQQQRNYSEALKRFSVVLSTHAKGLSRPERALALRATTPQ